MKPAQIKFRGFRTDGKGWVEGSLAFMFDNPKHPCIMPSCYFATRHFGEEDSNGNPILEDTMALGGFVSVVPESLGQFTGQTDKNGREIFGAIGERGGDITESAIFGRATIVWDEYQCGFIAKWESKEIQAIIQHATRHAEIIGNQFETE
jgi:hypothetical protein